jgi:hypothetical protein
MLDDPCVFTAEDIDDGTPAVGRTQPLAQLQDHVVAIGKDPIDRPVRLRVGLAQILNVGVEAFDAVLRLVLAISGTDESCGGVEVALKFLLFSAAS